MQSERDAVPATRHILGGKGDEPEVVGNHFHTLCPRSAELPDEDAVGGIALPVHLLEVLATHDSVFVNQEGAGERHPIPLVALGNVVVEDAKSPDDLRALVRKEREPKSSHTLAEVLKHVLAVVADGS